MNSTLSIDPNSPSALYNKRFALYRIKELDEAAVCNARLYAVDPGFVEALQNRGTKFFIPDTYRSEMDYSLPVRWYGGEANASENLSINMTEVPQHLETNQEPSGNQENNDSEYSYIPEQDENQGNESGEYTDGADQNQGSESGEYTDGADQDQGNESGEYTDGADQDQGTENDDSEYMAYQYRENESNGN